MSAVAIDMAPELYRLDDGAALFSAAWAEGWSLPEPLPIDQWADTYRVLPRESASEPGQWRTSRTPQLREPMQVLSDDHPCKRVVLVFGTQNGKTEVMNNWIGSCIHQDPSSIMVVQPNEQMGIRWTRQRFNPMVRLTSVLRERIAESRSRDGGNTATMKEFPGGILVVAHSHSAAALSSMPVRRLGMDEVDRYPEDVGGEGHPVDVASARTSSYPRRKELLASTPTIKGESVIWEEFEASDQRHYYVPCPHCGHYHVLVEENLMDDGAFMCPSTSGGCGAVIEEHHKPRMLELGRWIAHNPESDVVGFHLPSYYVALGLGLTWKEIVAKRAQAKANPERWKAYVNTIMAECYEDESGKVEWRDVADRAGGYASRTIPEGCLLLTAGIDTQDDRWAVEILGFGRGRWYTIDWFEVPGQPGIEEEWEKLDRAVLDVTFRNRYGVDMKVLAVGVDTGGHHTHTAYQYCRTRKHRRVLAMKGSKFYGRPIIPTRSSPQDVNVRGQVIRAGVDLWHIGTDTAKGAIFAKLSADAAADHEDYRFRFPGDLPDEFYQQLTAERYDTQRQRWVKPRHARNEALDCTVYALAAACHPAIRVDKLRDRDWEKIEEKVQPMVNDLFAAAEPIPVPRPELEQNHIAVTEAAGARPPAEAEEKSSEDEDQPTRPKRKKRKGGFVGGFSK